jgi:hypothetical protein
MSKGSISLLRANPALTTNIKIVVDSKYNLYLESYSANTELSNEKYKKYLINSEIFLSERIASFYKDLPADLAFEIKNNIKSDNIQIDFDNQYDDIYYSGPRSIEDTRYTEEYQYNTTLKIDPTNLPKWFFIFRVDGPGISTLDNTNIQDYFNDFKIIKSFDLSPKTSIGKLWEKNYIVDDHILRSPIELNFKDFEFSQWNGYDYYTGGTVSKSFFMQDLMQNQTTDFEFESFLIDGFKKNGVISSNYSNLSFLFDDTVSSIFLKSVSSSIQKYYEDEYPIIHKLIISGYIKTEQYNKTSEIVGNTFRIYYTFNEHIPYRKKWTINRYSGFYGNDLNIINKVSTHVPVIFKTGIGITIENNVFKLTGNNVNPVLSTYNEQLPIYFKIKNQFYLIEKSALNEYNLVADVNFNGMLDDFILNAQAPIKLEYEEETINTGNYHTYIKNVDNTFFNDFNIKYLSDNNSIIMIKIMDDFYKLKIDINNNFYLNTDEYIIADSNLLYRKLGNNNAQTEVLQILTKDNNVIYFEFYVFKFTDIADWDFNRLDTKYAQIEYDKNDSIKYNRPFIYMTDVTDVALPKDAYLEKYYNIHIEDSITQIKTQLTSNQYILPLTSEYGATGDLYMFNEINQLTRIWDINQSVTKWGIMNSINTNASPYKINNSLSVCGVYNMTPNLYVPNISIGDLNLDWFYTIGKPINYNFNNFYTLLNYSAYRTNNTVFRTLNLDMHEFITVDNSGTIEDIYKIDLDYYKDINAEFDYFEYIMNRPVIYNDTLDINLINHERVSYLNESDNVNGPSFFFKGIKAYLQWVDLENPNEISLFTTSPANELSGYAISILFNAKFTNVTALHGKAGIEIILNRKYKNILINLYIYTPHGSYTSLDYRERDALYNEENVLYSEYNVLTGAYVWKTSELRIKSLTLSTFIKIINDDVLEYENFSAGIKYTIVEEKIYYEMSNIELNVTDITNRTVKITFKNPTIFKQGDWIYFENALIPEFNKNLQVVNLIGNKTITLKFLTDQTSNVNTIFGSINSYLITKKQQVLPFKFKLVKPEAIKINTDVNIVTGDTSSPVLPTNSFKTNTNIVLSNDSTDGLIPYVYVDDDISRRIFKKNLNNELTFSQIDKLPTIYRFSGDYEPILNNIDLFNKTKLTLYSEGNVKYMTFTDGKLELHFTSIQPPNISINDIFYINNIDNSYWFLKYKTGHIIDILISELGGLYTYKVVLYYDWITPPIITDQDLIALNKTFDIKFMKKLEKNITFEYGYNNFAVNNNIIISKLYDTVNPLQTSIDINKTTNKFPMIDEHGVTAINRNIFKSQWDTEYYYSILINKYKTL